MVNKKLVSIIIPVYNGERYLGAAIESIMNQNHLPDEVIVVDDGSVDNTDLVARQYNESVIYVRQENRGPAAARNRGLSMAQGDIVGFLDADDLWPENKLSLQLSILTKSPSLEINIGFTQRIKLRKREDNESPFDKWMDPFFTLLLGAAVFRKTVFEKVGLFDETLYYGEDVDWFMRAREQNVSMMVIEHVVLLYRMHKSNMTGNALARDSYFLKALKKSLDRRRLEGEGPVAPVAKLDGIDRLIKYPPKDNRI